MVIVKKSNLVFCERMGETHCELLDSLQSAHVGAELGLSPFPY